MGKKQSKLCNWGRWVLKPRPMSAKEMLFASNAFFRIFVGNCSISKVSHRGKGEGEGQGGRRKVRKRGKGNSPPFSFLFPNPFDARCAGYVNTRDNELILS